MKILIEILCFLVALLTFSDSYSCPFCNSSVGKQVNIGIFNEYFWMYISIIILLFVLFVIIVLIVKKYLNNSIFEALILGGGIAGLFDGIFFHQILQIHNMFSNKLFPNTLINIEINMFWDGIFHIFTWIIILFGIELLWKNRKKYFGMNQNKYFYGSLLLGFGIFNLIEGILNHEIFQIHHVIQRASPSSQLFLDIFFLIFGAVIFIIAGIYMLNNWKVYSLSQ